MGETMAREESVSALSRVDLPTLGRPMMATGSRAAAYSPWVRWSGSVGSCDRPRLRLRRRIFFFGTVAGKCKRVEDGVEQIADAAAVFGGDGEELLHAEAAEVFCLRQPLVGVDFVDGEEDGLAGADEQAGELDVGRGEFGAAVDDHDDERAASSRAVRAWRKISAGISSASSGTMPPVSTMRAVRPAQSTSP